MFASTVLNYMDRQSIALIGPQIRRQFGVDFEGFGWVLTAFGLTYALLQIPAGMLVDRFGARRMYAGAVAFWSFAAIATAFSPTLGVLIACRALLGVGEAFNWPCALSITRDILPPKDRSLGNGIFNSGAAVGAVLTPITVPFLTRWFGWQIAFVILGVLGFAWVVAWRLAMRSSPIATMQPVAVPSSASAGMSMRARGAYLSVVGISAAIAALCAILPARVALPFERIRPDGPIELLEWRAQPGAIVRRNQVLAECAIGKARLSFLSPIEGRLIRPLVLSASRVQVGDAVCEIDDSVGPVKVRIDGLKPYGDFWLVGWMNLPGTRVRQNEPLAHVEFQGGASGTILAPFPCRVVDETLALRRSITASDPMLMLEVRGFQAQAWGLTGIWLAAAFLMWGLLLVSRALPLNALGSGWPLKLGQITRLRNFWILVIVSCTINVAWHFLVNWLPTYLQTDRKMSYLAGGLFAALPFLAADAGNLLGGTASRAVSDRVGDAPRARILVMGVCVVLISCGAFVGVIPTTGVWEPVLIAMLCYMALGAAGYMANYFAFCQEVSAPLTGLIVGYLGALGNLFAAGFNPVAGRLKDTTGSFSAVFVAVGLLPIAGWLLLALGWRSNPDKTASSAQSA